MINTIADQLITQFDKSESCSQNSQSTAKSSESTLGGKSVTPAETNLLALESASHPTDVAILARDVKPDSEQPPLPETHLDHFVSWQQLPRQITEALSFREQSLFAIYLGLPIPDIMNKFRERHGQGQPEKFDYISWYSQQQATRLIQEKITITHETLLTMLAGISRPDLTVLHCDYFGIVPEQVRFLRENQSLETDDNGVLSVWPDCVKAFNTDAALNHELDFFKLCKFVIGDRDLSGTQSATLAFAAGYPELMEEQDLQQLSKAPLRLSNPLLLKKILDKKGGSMKTRELVEIMSNPEIMAIRSAHKLINALQGQPAHLDAAEETSLIRQTGHLGFELASIGINAESFALALGLPLHINQKILNRVDKNDCCYRKISKLLSTAKSCLPQLTPGYIAHASMVAAKSCNCDSKLLNLFQEKGEHYAFFRNFNGKKPPQVKPLCRQDNNVSTKAKVSKPLTMDFLRCLPLSHNWLLIGLTMGLSKAELEGIGKKVNADGWISLGELSLAAYELSRILVQPERGLETGHLFQALKYLDDQAALAYFPDHLSGDPDNPLPGHIAKSLETGRLMTRLVQTCNTEEISGFLTLFDKYD